MFDDGDRLFEMRQKCQVHLGRRVQEFIHDNPGVKLAEIAEFASRTLEEAWLLNAGVRVRYAEVQAREIDTREED